MSEEQDQQKIRAFKPALLTRTEIEWLSGKVQGLSKAYERRLRFTIRRKIKALTNDHIQELTKATGLIVFTTFVKNGYVIGKCNIVTTDYNATNIDNRMIPDFVPKP